MTHLIATIEQAFTDRELRYDLQYRAEEDRYIFFLTMATSTGRFSIVCQVMAKDNLIMWIGGMPANVPEQRRQQVALHINQKNWKLNVGNWEMDPTDGELRFRYAYLFDPDLPITEEIIMNSLACIYSIVNDNMNAWMELMYGITPEAPPANQSGLQASLPFWCN
ncbi:hypothetical protein GCM10028805_33090 [Spirosoma harenae]